MCGRYTLRRVNMVHAAMEATPVLPFEEFSERGRFNVAPSQAILLTRINSQGQRVMELARWGLIPYWSKALPKLQPINARAETVASSGLFRGAFDRRRCLIPADGFYEWKAMGAKKPKQPYYIHFKDDRIFAFAGLYERWKPSPDAEPIETCTIITTDANDLVRPIHDRMPVILDARDYDRWLNPDLPGEAVKDLLHPHSADEMEAYTVSPRVNRPATDEADLVQPCEGEKTLWDGV